MAGCQGAGGPANGHCGPQATLLALQLATLGARLALAEEPVGWKTPNIVLESSTKTWSKVPEPFFQPGDPQPHPPTRDFRSQAPRDNSTVVVLIAALRETRVVRTLLSLFESARLPDRVYAGVVQQNAAGDPDVLEELCRQLGTPLKLRKRFAGRERLHVRQEDDDEWGQGRFTEESISNCRPARNVRVHRMDVGEAKGPAYARSRQPLLISDGEGLEDFCMQIDAHTLFSPNWDDHMIHHWALADNEYAVLSTYPTSADLVQQDGTLPNVNDHWEMPFLCDAALQQPGVVRNHQAGAAANLERPLLGKFWAAGLSFSRCHAERDVPNDPGLEHVFDGEEFGRAVRLYTNGYDLYTLMRPVVGTFYGGAIRSKGGWSRAESRARNARARLATLCRYSAGNLSVEALAELKGFDLGSRRNLEDYIALTGIDTVNHKAEKTPCLVSRWTPWRSDLDPPYAEMLSGSPLRHGVDIAAQLGLQRRSRLAPLPPPAAIGAAAAGRGWPTLDGGAPASGGGEEALRGAALAAASDPPSVTEGRAGSQLGEEALRGAALAAAGAPPSVTGGEMPDGAENLVPVAVATSLLIAGFVVCRRACRRGDVKTT